MYLCNYAYSRDNSSMIQNTPFKATSPEMMGEPVKQELR